MSAAALKPAMFGHLLASRPEGPDRGSVSATLVSLGLHATLALLLVWASMTQPPAAPDRRDTVIPPVVFYAPAPHPQSKSPATDGASAGGGARLMYPVPTHPLVGVSEIPAQPGLDFASIEHFAAGAESSRARVGLGGDGNAPTRDDGFRILSVMPALLNLPAVQQALSANYPPFLRDAGIGGQALVWVLLDEQGRVIRAELKESSGQHALDDAALRVAPLMKFSPALNRNQRVKVWVSLPIRFRVE
jgi:TonB family protein